ncbi:MAG: sigma-70 family RNA polymerase sigma factor [Leptolyngbya sp.]|nr:sigma-70 family RNA polymerase sigma factor [Candidatus Melainabacteria bacterium]
MLNSVSKRRHPFADLERHFQTLVIFISKTTEVTSDVEAACQMIRGRVYHATSQMLRRWHVPNRWVEAEDIVQLWHVAMWERGYARCDRDRPVYPYAYQMLRYLCIGVLKRVMKSTSEICENQPTERAGWLDAMEHTEMLTALEQEIGKLPTNLRWAVEQWLASRRSGHRLLFPSGESRRKFHNLLFRARRRLRALLVEEPHCQCEFKDLERATEVQPVRRAISLRSKHPSLI